MRMVMAMVALALLLDGAMVLQHEHAQRAGAPHQTVSMMADSGDAPALTAR